jgi:hypothetical protein
MTNQPRASTPHATNRFGDALRRTGSRAAGTVEIEAVDARAAKAAAAAFRDLRHAAPAALLAVALGAVPARADEPEPAIMLLALGGGAHGVLSVPMHVDTRGLPAVVVVHDARGRASRAGLHVEQLLAQGITVLEIEPFAHRGDIEAATLVIAAAETLALAEGLDPGAIGAIGFGAGARAVRLAGDGAMADPAALPAPGHVEGWDATAFTADPTSAAPANVLSVMPLPRATR